MISIRKCPICEGLKFKHFIEAEDYSNTKEMFNIVSCETCDFTITSPRPKDSGLAKYYVSENYISHTNKKNGLFNFLYQTIRKYAIKNKLSILNSMVKETNHLDIGCGTGEFLHACKEAGFKTKGIEPSSIAREQAIKNYDLDVTENTDLSMFSNNLFSSISMWHVLEHIPKLEETVKNLKQILSNEGIVIVAVPNKDSWDAKYYGKFWAAWDVPIHLWHFSQKSIKFF